MNERAPGPSSEELRRDVARAIERSRRLASRVAEVEDQVAAVEDQLAETSDRLTAQRGDPEYRERAEEARAMARLARQLAEREREASNAGVQVIRPGRPKDAALFLRRNQILRLPSE